jgi:hypothetical protein
MDRSGHKENMKWSISKEIRIEISQISYEKVMHISKEVTEL